MQPSIVERLITAAQPFANQDECGIGMRVGEDDEHTKHCTECKHIIELREAILSFRSETANPESDFGGWECKVHGDVSHYNIINTSGPPGNRYHWKNGGQCFGPFVYLGRDASNSNS